MIHKFFVRMYIFLPNYNKNYYQRFNLELNGITISILYKKKKKNKTFIF